MNQISLTAPMRSNLLSLQNIARQQDIVQNRLATGLKVSSAIDNPSAYYTAASLSNRAADLTALLDAMSQGVQTIKTASEAIDSATKFLEQAKATANQALETSQPIAARVSNEEELLAAVASGQQGFIVLENDITLTETLELKDGQKLVGDNYFQEGLNLPNRKLKFSLGDEFRDAVSLGNNSTFSNLDISVNTRSNGEGRFAVNAAGKYNLNISNLNIYMEKNDGISAAVNLSSGCHDVTFSGTITTNINSASSTFGLRINNGKNIIIDGKLNCKSDDSAANYALFASSGSEIICQAESVINTTGNIQLSNSSLDFYGQLSGRHIRLTADSILNVMDNAEINLKNNTSSGIAFDLGSGTLNIYKAIVNLQTGPGNQAALSKGSSNDAGLSVLNLHSGSILNINTQASYAIWLRGNSAENGMTINAMNGSKLNINSPTGIQRSLYNTFNFYSGAEIAVSQNNNFLGYWEITTDWQLSDTMTSDLTSKEGLFCERKNDSEAPPVINLPDLAPDTFTPQTFTAGTVSLIKCEDFSTILDQYDSLIKDASYKGINLLDGQNLKVNFNEDRSSMIEVPGYDVNTENLGLVTKEWNSQEDIEKSISELEGAISSLRSFASAFGNYYSIVTTRQDFTENLINVLEEGADKLTLADINEESANMLALQTSQQLAINSLSLASQAAQSVLKLF